MKLRWMCLGVLVVGCGERTPVAPRPAGPSASAFDLVGSSPTLLKCSPLPADTTTQAIGPDGGVLRVGPHTLTIPAGALAETVTITAVVPADSVNRVHFEPHGLTFDRSASLTLSYANCQGMGSLLPKQVVYATADLQILELLPSLDNLLGDRVTGQIRHFSDYAVAW